MEWTTVYTNDAFSLTGVWGSADELFAVGTDGTMLHYDGEWSVEQEHTNWDLWSVWGSGSGDIFAVGDRGTRCHYDGAWSCFSTNTVPDLHSVWGSTNDHVFAIGEYGAILRYPRYAFKVYLPLILKNAQTVEMDYRLINQVTIR